MAKQFTHISIFLASPSDLSEERKAVREMVDELNVFVRTTLGIHLDLLTWETNSYPSAGIDAQDVINNQIGDDYDIFIGMMWQKFGTATGRAGSGTEEEFERAYNRHKETNGQTKIMLYFSSKPIAPDDINVEQLNKVREFKSKAQALGILYGTFNDSESFKNLLKIHLLNHISQINKSIQSSSIININNNHHSINFNNETVKDIIDDKNDVDITEEAGYLDLMEIYQDNFSQAEVILTDMSGHVNNLTDQLNRNAERMDVLSNTPNRTLVNYKALIDKTAADITNYVNLTNVELPRFNDLFTTGIDSLSNALTIRETSGVSIDKSELETLLASIDSTQNSFNYAISGITKFRDSAKGLPPATKVLSKATKLLLSTLNNLISELNNANTLLSELRKTVSSILSRSTDASLN